jgi:hypothetical protein
MDLPRRHKDTNKTFWALCLRVCVAISCVAGWVVASPIAQTDLDDFMREVLARRDENWKKLQQYILDEHEAIDLRGPARVPMWGDRRDYTWYVRDGFFVRSPVKANGVTVAEDERRKYEADYLKRQQEREKRGNRAGSVSIGPSGMLVETRDDPDAPAGAPADVDGILKQTRQPQFISSAYFLRFKFEEGKYALVEREKLDGIDTLKIEYYPTKLFTGSDRRRASRDSKTDQARDEAFRGLMNKVALITLWVEPNAHQVIKYTFDNIGFDFLPGQWLVHVDDVKASMTMQQPFADAKDIWLPRTLELTLAMTMAAGQFDLRYGLEYTDYRRPDVASKVTIKH